MRAAGSPVGPRGIPATRIEIPLFYFSILFIVTHGRRDCYRRRSRRQCVSGLVGGSGSPGSTFQPSGNVPPGLVVCKLSPPSHFRDISLAVFITGYIFNVRTVHYRNDYNYCSVVLCGI